MTDVTVVMRDGRTYCGPIWMWRPKEGWFQLVLDRDLDPTLPERFWLRDVASAIEKGLRVGISEGRPVLADVDLIKQARDDGWDGT